MTALLTLLRRQFFNAMIWQVVAVAALVAIPVTNYLTLAATQQEMRFITRDSRDTIYLTRVGTFEDAVALHTDIAQMAAETIFSRNPSGYDYQARLERLFNPDTTKQLLDAASKDASIFDQQQVHQKFEAGDIHELSVDNNTVKVSVAGQILRTCLFNNRTVNDSRKVTVFLRLQVNDDMTRNGRYPLVVTDYQERFE